MKISKNRFRNVRPLAPDPHYNNVTLLLTMDGANGSTTFVDRSLNANTLTPNGWSLTTSNFKYGWSSAQSPISPTNSNGIQITPTTALQMGASDFTFEAWVNVRNTNHQVLWLFNIFTGVINDAIYMSVFSATQIEWEVGTYNSGLVSYSFPANTWVHVAQTRSGNSVRLFINGTQVGTTGTYSGTLPTQDRMWLGRTDRNGSSPLPMNGFIDDFRITKGVARYTSNFTPPSSFLQTNAPSYRISSRYEADPFYESVSLLLKMDGANGSTTFTDSSPTPKIVTRNGNTIISNARINPRIGTTSAYFDGSGDYLTTPSSVDFDFGTGDFTIECWIYCGNHLGNMVSARDWAGNGITFRVYQQKLEAFYGVGNGNITASTTHPLNTWVHAALVRIGNTATLYQNGVNVGSSNLWNVFVNQGITRLDIGTWNTQEYFSGYIDDLRITKGIARYTSNFTVPNESFPAFGVRTFRMPLSQILSYNISDVEVNPTFNMTSTQVLSINISDVEVNPTFNMTSTQVLSINISDVEVNPSFNMTSSQIISIIYSVI